MVIFAADHIRHCYTNADGNIIYNLIRDEIVNGLPVELSFKGFDSVSSSFVNSAFIALLDDVSFDVIKRNLKITNSTRQINEMIKKSFYFEVNERHKLIEV